MHLDIYARVTARIVQALEDGVAPWVRPWTGEADPVPINATTRRPYRGINNLMLQLEAGSRGYERNVWMTFRQALELGAHVRKGETGAPIVFWQLRRVGAVAGRRSLNAVTSDLDERVIPLVRAYTVFNIAQIDGLPPEMASAAALSAVVAGPRGRRDGDRGIRCRDPSGRLQGLLPAHRGLRADATAGVLRGGLGLVLDTLHELVALDRSRFSARSSAQHALRQRGVRDGGAGRGTCVRLPVRRLSDRWAAAARRATSATG